MASTVTHQPETPESSGPQPDASSEGHAARLGRAAKRVYQRIQGPHFAEYDPTKTGMSPHEVAGFWGGKAVHSQASDVGFWRYNKADTLHTQEGVRELQATYAEGVEALVKEGFFEPVVLNRLPNVRLTPIYEADHDHPESDQGRGGFIYHNHSHMWVEDLGNTQIDLHEFGHRLFLLGGGMTLLNEELADVTATEVMRVKGIPIKERSATQQRLNHVAARVRAQAGVTMKEVATIAAGADRGKDGYLPVSQQQERNYNRLKNLAKERTGWDIIGYFDNILRDTVLVEMELKNNYTQALDAALDRMEDKLEQIAQRELTTTPSH